MTVERLCEQTLMESFNAPMMREVFRTREPESVPRSGATPIERDNAGAEKIRSHRGFKVFHWYHTLVSKPAAALVRLLFILFFICLYDRLHQLVPDDVLMGKRYDRDIVDAP